MYTPPSLSSVAGFVGLTATHGVGHAAASPHHHKENAWRKHHRRVHLAVAVKVTARQLDKPCDSLAIPPPPQNEKMRTKIYGCQHFEMPNVMQPTYFGSHLVVI